MSAAGLRATDVPAVTSDVAAEAAVWVTRLHGPSRTRQMELECLAWQARSAAHREAFERCTDVWQDVPRVSLANAFEAASPVREPSPRAPVPLRWAAAMGVVLALVTGATGYMHWQDRDVFSTGIGEQRLVVLDDGTRLTLNTDSRAKVELAADRRTVTVQRGEALFDVAKDAARPFAVRVAGSEVLAVGTMFAVRLTEGGANPGALDVTLIEGQVTVRSAPGAHGLAPDKPVQMRAGERVRLTGARASSAAAAVRVDRPNLEQVVAWKRSEAVFDGTLLADAVAEMNRYSRTPIVLLDQSLLANLRVSGIYRTGDVAGFASAVAALHGLQARERDGRLELSKAH
jgi:transmembrane sensor